MTSKSEPNFKEFPKASVQTIAGNWWNSKTYSALKKPKPPSEARSTGANILDIQPELSSQQAVGILLDLKGFLGYEPKPNKVILKGGYKSRDQFITKLCEMLQKDFNAHYGITEQPGQTSNPEVSSHAQT